MHDGLPGLRVLTDIFSTVLSLNFFPLSFLIQGLDDDDYVLWLGVNE